ncbi:3'-5' exonuclease [Enterobacteriaceae bacterium 4M9]|nr:3'-5' exonuclease [Enterobacteriaceae bacterium 4M9]
MLKHWLKYWKTPPTQEALRASIVPEPTWPHALKNYLQHPLPDESQPLSSQHFVALDFETTGLNANVDKILSIGMVDFTFESINIASSAEIYINHSEFIRAETAQINGLTPQALAQGLTITEGMNRLLENIQNKIVLAHGSGIEKAFIHAYFTSQYNIGSLPAYFIDTLQIEKQLSYAGKSGNHQSYQLDDLRRHYQLPGYLSHSATSDALACAELFLVQSKKLDMLPGMSHRQLMQLLR